MRDGTRGMLAAALQWEVCAYIEAHADQLDSDGYRLVVRNGSVVVAGTGLPRPPDVGRQDTTRITQHVTAGRPSTTRKPALPVESEACGYCASFPLGRGGGDNCPRAWRGGAGSARSSRWPAKSTGLRRWRHPGLPHCQEVISVEDVCVVVESPQETLRNSSFYVQAQFAGHVTDNLPCSVRSAGEQQGAAAAWTKRTAPRSA